MSAVVRIVTVGFAIAAVAVWMLTNIAVHAHDDGSHANDPLKPWFDQLASGNGLCCSFADGVKVEDVDWDMDGANFGPDGEMPAYRVRIKGQWINVPPEAVITEPNKFGRAVVWPYDAYGGITKIRCFIPGVEG